MCVLIAKKNPAPTSAPHGFMNIKMIKLLWDLKAALNVALAGSHVPMTISIGTIIVEDLEYNSG